jgi:hypothetical protein
MRGGYRSLGGGGEKAIQVGGRHTATQQNGRIRTRRPCQPARRAVTLPLCDRGGSRARGRRRSHRDRESGEAVRRPDSRRVRARVENCDWALRNDVSSVAGRGASLAVASDRFQIVSAGKCSSKPLGRSAPQKGSRLCGQHTRFTRRFRGCFTLELGALEARERQLEGAPSELAQQPRAQVFKPGHLPPQAAVSAAHEPAQRAVEHGGHRRSVAPVMAGDQLGGREVEL